MPFTHLINNLHHTTYEICNNIHGNMQKVLLWLCDKNSTLIENTKNCCNQIAAYSSIGYHLLESWQQGDEEMLIDTLQVAVSHPALTSSPLHDAFEISLEIAQALKTE